MTKKTEKKKQDKKAQKKHDDLCWALIDVIANDLKIKDYENLKKKHKSSENGYVNFITSIEFISQLEIFKKIIASQNKIDLLTATLANRVSTILVKLKLAMFDQNDSNNNITPKQITINQTIYNLLNLFSKLNWALLAEIWDKLDTAYEENLNNKIINDTDAFQEIEEYSFKTIQEYLKVTLEWYSALRVNCNEQFKLIAEKVESEAATMLIHSHIYNIEANGATNEEISKAIEQIHVLKQKAERETYYWACAHIYGRDLETLTIAKTYFQKYIQILKKDTNNTKDYSRSITGLAQLLRAQIETQINNKQDLLIYQKLSLYKDAIFYAEMSIENLNVFIARNTNNNNSETSKEIAEMFLDGEKIHLNNLKTDLIKFKTSCLTQIQSNLVNLFVTEANQKDGQFTIEVKIPSQIYVLLNMLYKEGINCAIDKDNSNKIIVRDIINVSVTKITDVIKNLEVQLNLVKSETVKSVGKEILEDRIPNLPMQEDKLTQTQQAKLKKGKAEVQGPSIKEQIKVSMEAKKKKQPKKITFFGENGQPDYIYDESDPDCKVFRLQGGVAKRQFVRINENLHAYLAENDPDLLTALQKLCANGTVEFNSKGHTCFILEGKPFNEQKAGLQKVFYLDSTIENLTDSNNNMPSAPTGAEEDSNNNNNNNNNDNNNSAHSISVTDKNKTYAKGKIWHMQGRVFGCTSRISTKENDANKHYHLIEINSVNLKK